MRDNECDHPSKCCVFIIAFFSGYKISSSLNIRFFSFLSLAQLSSRDEQIKCPRSTKEVNLDPDSGRLLYAMLCYGCNQTSNGNFDSC